MKTNSCFRALPGLLFAFTFMATINVFGQLPGLIIKGDPQSTTGATWTYKATLNGVVYDLSGILIKPTGNGPFPAVIINHGSGGNANGYSKTIAKTMVTWGYVCIAVNLTHAGGVACGSPGNCTVFSDLGASQANILRAMKGWDILNSLTYVNDNCIMAFGHSRGAFLTTAIVGLNPTKFKAAAHTAGGISDKKGTVAPSSTVARGIRSPYMMHHGDIDTVVELPLDTALNDVLNSTGVTHILHVYPGYDHNTITYDTLMLNRTKSWFATYGCPLTGRAYMQGEHDTNQNDIMSIIVHPNPASDYIWIENKSKEAAQIKMYNAVGQEVIAAEIEKQSQQKIDVSKMDRGMHFINIRNSKLSRSLKVEIK